MNPADVCKDDIALILRFARMVPVRDQQQYFDRVAYLVSAAASVLTFLGALGMPTNCTPHPRIDQGGTHEHLQTYTKRQRVSDSLPGMAWPEAASSIRLRLPTAGALASQSQHRYHGALRPFSLNPSR